MVLGAVVERPLRKRERNFEGWKQVLHPDGQVSDPDTKGLCGAKGL
ncbi:hypothetical protein AtDm6_0890 [Acetobacter tropicalis]|uniref:Uncharacterized protein n=1 Tax=Acetobacter tropicalis TaxID=104102 RepID=A0A094YX19_9PROT|nr:hypothetical protein AtDm6_0890 [Acetobacter tropicalis]